MKQALIAATIGIAFLIASCSTNTNPVQSETQLKSDGAVQTNDVIHEDYDYTIDADNDCTGGHMVGGGKFGVDISHKMKADGSMEMRYMINAKATAYDEDGKKYEFKYNEIFGESYAPESCPFSYSDKGRIIMTTSGGKNNQEISFNFKIIVDCDFNVDVVVDEFEITCK